MPPGSPVPHRLPAFCTHYARGAPFRSVTAHPPERWPELVAALGPDDAWGLARYRDPHYLPRRRAVEQRLRAELLARGGAPVLDCPFYAVLGRHPAWEVQDRPGMRAWMVDLDALPPGALSFTFGDSLLTWDPAYRAQAAALGRSLDPRAGRLYTLDEILRLAEEAPAEEDLAAALEVQLWAEPSNVDVRVVELASFDARTSSC